jgi:ribosomal-protein-alanine N-acetyltransferase
MLKLTEMKEMHLPAILALEELCFSIPWSRQSFLFEIKDNQLAHYLVMLAGERPVAYGGMWVIGKEAHVTNVAVHPDFRRRGIGEALVRGLMVKATGLGVTGMTLEVRRSNAVAQGLYRKLGFVPSGYRKGYYQDNQEDALVMWNNELNRWKARPSVSNCPRGAKRRGN